MGIETALEIVTSPKLTERQQLVKFIAERANLRYPQPNQPDIGDIWYIIAIMLRWGLIEAKNGTTGYGWQIASYSRKALGMLAQDSLDVFRLIRTNNL